MTNFKQGLRHLRPSGRSLVWLIVVCTAAFLFSLKYNDGDGGSEPARELQVVDLVGDPACEPEGQICYAMAGAVRVALRFDTGARALQPFPVAVRIDGGDDLQPAGVQVDFIMVGMDMGQNRYALARGADGWWRGKVTLPVCSSGRTDWQAIVRVSAGSTQYVARFPFKLG